MHPQERRQKFRMQIKMSIKLAYKSFTAGWWHASYILLILLDLLFYYKMKRKVFIDFYCSLLVFLARIYIFGTGHMPLYQSALVYAFDSLMVESLRC